MDAHAKEVSQGDRFRFGENWSRFLSVLDEQRIATAEQSLMKMLKVNLQGVRFLDAGSGSGLFSLAARRMGARVHSFDYDPKSVACTNELRSRYFPGDEHWTVEQGSVLDSKYLQGLGQFDIVYSWGVLHHTGAMWEALGNLDCLVAPNGLLFVAIYNDQGKPSRRWLKIKQLYNRMPRATRFLLLWLVLVQSWWRRFTKDLLLHANPLRTWNQYKNNRGMSPWWDLVDWVGGYPFEVAKPEDIFYFYKQRSYSLLELRTEGGDLGCNEFVFQKTASSQR